MAHSPFFDPAPAVTDPASGSTSDLARVAALQLIVALIWGGTWIAGRILAHEISPIAAGGWRFLLGTLTLGVLVWRTERRIPPLDAKNAWRVFVMGAVGIFAYSLCFFFGLQHIQAGRGALVVALNPVAVALAAALFLGERLTPKKSLGVAIAMLGCLIVVGRGDPFALLRGEVGLGELLIIGCVIGWTIYTLIGRRAGGTLSPLVMTFYASVAGGALLIATGIITGPLRQWPQLSWQGWLSLLYLGVLGSGFSYVWYAHGVVRLGATRAAAFINFVPISALVFGVLLLGEHVGLAVLAGGVLVLGGVWLTNRPTTKKELR